MCEIAIVGADCRFPGGAHNAVIIRATVLVVRPSLLHQ